MNAKLQAAFFDITSNRFNPELLLNPSPAQRMELMALEKFLKPNSRLIDFGAGNGRVSLYFLKRGYHVLAVDVSKQSLVQLTSIYQKHKNSSWGKLTTSLSLPKRTADAIVGADILHHITIKEMLPKLKAALKPGGQLVFSEPNALHLPWYLFYFWRRIPWSIEKGILQCNYFTLRKFFSIQGHGLLPTPLLSGNTKIAKLNLWFGNLPIFKLFSFRLIVSTSIPSY